LRSLPVVLVIRCGNDVIRFLRFRVPVRFGGRPDGRFGPWRAAVRPHPWLEKTIESLFAHESLAYCGRMAEVDTVLVVREDECDEGRSMLGEIGNTIHDDGTISQRGCTQSGTNDSVIGGVGVPGIGLAEDVVNIEGRGHVASQLDAGAKLTN